MAATGRKQVRRATGGGAIAGIVGGLIMALFMVVTSLISNQNLWHTLQAPGALFFGHHAMQSPVTLGSVTVGLVIHLLVSAVLGVLFGLQSYGLSKPVTVLAGTIYGVGIWLVMLFLVLPIVGLNGTMSAMHMGPTFLRHVLFGIFVGLAFLPFQRTRTLALVRKTA